MTRSVTIVNTSNWDGEDYIVRVHGTGVVVGRDVSRAQALYHKDGLRLSPGESVSLTPGPGEQIAFTEQAPETGTRPFRQAYVKDGTRHDRQVWPVVKVTLSR